MRSKHPKVVIGASLQPGGDVVLLTGLAMARALGAEAHVVHALPIDGLVAPVAVPFLSSEAIAALKRDRHDELTARVVRLKGEGAAPAVVVVEEGAAHRVLLESARALHADLLVMGCADRDEPSPGLGTTTDRVLRRATCPVLVVRGLLPIPPRRVLLPVDLSPLAAEAFRAGLRLLSPTEAAEPPTFTALLVVGDHPRLAAGDPGEVARQALDLFVTEHTPPGSPRARTEVRHGRPRRQILKHIEEEGDELVVLGTHGCGGFEHLLLGSVTSDLVHGSPVSLLVVPPAAALAEEMAGEIRDKSRPKCPPDPHAEFYG